MSSEAAGEEEEVQRPARQTLRASLARDANWKCLVLTLLIYACLAAVAWCRTASVARASVAGLPWPVLAPSSQRHPPTHHHQRAPLLCSPACPPVIINLSLYPTRSARLTSPCEDGYMYVPVAFLAMLYLLYLVECWHCSAGAWAGGPRLPAACLLHRIQEMREAQPVVWWKAVCYHYVRRKRQVTRYRHGDAYTSTQRRPLCQQVYYERVNSHAAGACFVYAYCGSRDISPKLLLDSAGPITRVRFSKGFAFANAEAAAEFEEQRARFFVEHERRDDYLEMREGLDLAPGAGAAPGPSPFRDTATAFADPARPPWFARPLAFWLASCLLLSWPLRLLVEYNTAYVHYQVTKLFGVNYESAPAPAGSSPPPAAEAPVLTPGSGPGGSGGRLSRGSTLDSTDPDCSIRANCSLAPSYSEALLLPGAGPPLSRSSTHGRLLLFFPAPLAPRRPDDPFGGRALTTPTEDPPPYEDALRLPSLSLLRRSLTERGELSRRWPAPVLSAAASLLLLQPRRSEPAAVTAEVNQVRLGRARLSMETSL